MNVGRDTLTHRPRKATGVRFGICLRPQRTNDDRGLTNDYGGYALLLLGHLQPSALQ